MDTDPNLEENKTYKLKQNLSELVKYFNNISLQIKIILPEHNALMRNMLLAVNGNVFLNVCKI